VSALSVELELIDSARRALAQGNQSPRAALHKLDEYRRRFPNGRLRTEATILRIEALMAAGDRAAASRLAKSVLDRAPNSPYARRVRSLLGDE
jgi:outer membrane protein assembly factor BamD (BamD/ComL family)